jgi:large subunit ribosomal protein L28
MLPTTALLESLSLPFKRAQLGLFHGKSKQYGNNVPFSKKKTRRTWLPNIQNKRLESAALGRLVEVKLTTRALRTIKKASRTRFPQRKAAQDSSCTFTQHGGLDNYVLKTKAELLGWEGMRIRLLVRAAMEEKELSKTLSAAAAELEALRPQLGAARSRVGELIYAGLAKREEALRNVWRLEDRSRELERQLTADARPAS